jgi:hypothetical protein
MNPYKKITRCTTKQTIDHCQRMEYKKYAADRKKRE